MLYSRKKVLKSEVACFFYPVAKLQFAYFMSFKVYASSVLTFTSDAKAL